MVLRHADDLGVATSGDDLNKLMKQLADWILIKPGEIEYQSVEFSSSPRRKGRRADTFETEAYQKLLEDAMTLMGLERSSRAAAAQGKRKKLTEDHFQKLNKEAASLFRSGADELVHLFFARSMHRTNLLAGWRNRECMIFELQSIFVVTWSEHDVP
jgi:hypothetical protein